MIFRHHRRASAVRAFLLATACLAAGSLLFAPAALGYKLGGKKWPTRTITYNASAAPKYAEAIRRATKAWNTSGARVRFKATSRRRARLRIFETNQGIGGGNATLGWHRPLLERRVKGRPLVLKGIPLPCNTRVRGLGRISCKKVGPFVKLDVPTSRKDPFTANDMASVVAHELGHSLGLKHVRNKCAVMSYQRERVCAKPQAWQLRCRLLESDDIRGAIKRYGGRMRPLPPEFCDESPAPTAPTGLTATFDPNTRLILASWTDPATPGLVNVALRPGACPPDFGSGTPVEGRPGRRNATVLDPGEGSGRHCIGVRIEDEYGRVSAPATVELLIPPPPEPG